MHEIPYNISVDASISKQSVQAIYISVMSSKTLSTLLLFNSLSKLTSKLRQKCKFWIADCLSGDSTGHRKFSFNKRPIMHKAFQVLAVVISNVAHHQPSCICVNVWKTDYIYSTSYVLSVLLPLMQGTPLPLSETRVGAIIVTRDIW